MDSSLLRFLAGWFLPIWPLVHWQDERLGWPAGESKVTKSPKCWYSTGFLFSVYLFSTAWKNIVMRETSKDILTTSARILLSHTDLNLREDVEGLSSEETLFLRIASAAEGLVLAAILSVIFPRWMNYIVKRNPLWRNSFQHLQKEETNLILSQIGYCIFFDCPDNHYQVLSRTHCQCHKMK